MGSLDIIAKKLFGTQNDRELKSIQPYVVRTNEWEPKIKPLDNAALKAKTAEFRERLSRGETIDSILPEAFATVREAAWRTIGQRHYDVQLIGGVTLHRGRISEMKTGEGKTLVATLACYLNALEGKGVHVITVNDYLARRDSAWMGQIYGFLGLSTGVIVHGLTDKQRQQNYGCDITYGTNNEFGFDYLRDNMKFRLEDYVQRDLHYAIVDEVDSILIDEARTPLIISGPTDDSSELYYKIDRTILSGGGLTKEEDYTVDEKSKTASLTEHGVEKMEQRLGVANLYDPVNIELLHHVNQGLRAHVLFKCDVDYVVKDGEVMIVDEFTGRLMPGRRWSDGLHQAIEAKENVRIENENQTLATITFQNYFRMYKKLAGMTGTADTEATEFRQIYKLDVTVIPTNKNMVRKDQADLIYKSQDAKFRAIAKEIRALHEKGQPVLVGTISVERSEMLAALLKREGIRHNVLNAKQHDREADIVAQAGRRGQVTISTNMAGRGTDILLGGNPDNLARAEIGLLKVGATEEERADYQKRFDEAVVKWRAKCVEEKKEVLAAGGLFILGTERHESRRIDNQLRGRAGRQGDPGESRFYLSFEDDLLRIFGQSELLKRTVKAMEEDVPIEHKWTTKAIENAQRKVEGHNYDIRKHLLEYDDVMNQQRKVVYAWRREVLSRPSLRDMVFSMVDEAAEVIASEFFPGGRLRKENGQARLDRAALSRMIMSMLQFSSDIDEKDIIPFNDKGLKKLVLSLAGSHYAHKEKTIGLESMRQIEKMILLTTIDQLWKDHLLAMDHLREGIGLQGYGQKDPLIAYKKEGFKFFQLMMGQISEDVLRKIFAVQMAPDDIEAEYDTEGFDEDEEESAEDEPTRGREAKSDIKYNVAPDGSLVERKPQPLDFSKMGRTPKNMTMGRGQMLGAPGGAPPGGGGAAAMPQQSDLPKVGRNDPCPCGSGKKYKKCHGA